MNTQLVREFETADADATLALWARVLPSENPWNEPTAELSRKTQRLDNLVYVAELQDRIVGAVVAGYDGMRGWIYRLAVDPDFRRRGIGSQLVSTAEEALLRRGCPKINLQVRSDNSEVVAFYEKLGYAIESRASLGKPLTFPETPFDPVPKLPIENGITLSHMSLDDRDSLVKHLNATGDIHEFTSSIPFPYNDFDADVWLRFNVHASLDINQNRNWAIRNDNGEMIGSIGLFNMRVGEKAEIGYWLAKEWRGRGIMTQSVQAVCEQAFTTWDLFRVYAGVFANNPTSPNVLKRCGFTFEGTQRSHFIRDGVPVDVLMFGRLR